MDFLWDEATEAWKWLGVGAEDQEDIAARGVLADSQQNRSSGRAGRQRRGKGPKEVQNERQRRRGTRDWGEGQEEEPQGN